MYLFEVWGRLREVRVFWYLVGGILRGRVFVFIVFFCIRDIIRKGFSWRRVFKFRETNGYGWVLV